MSIFVHIDPARTFCQEENFTDIVLRKRWSRTKADTVGWSTTLSHNDPLYNQLARAYWFMKRRAAFTKWKLEFYDGVSYTVRDGSKSVHVRINVATSWTFQRRERESPTRELPRSFVISRMTIDTLPLSSLTGSRRRHVLMQLWTVQSMSSNVQMTTSSSYTR